MTLNFRRSSPTFSPVIYCGTKYVDAHSGKEMIPERVPTFGVCSKSLITSEPKAERRKPRSGVSEHSANYASFAAHATRFAGANSVRPPVRVGRVSLSSENAEFHHVSRAS